MHVVVTGGTGGLGAGVVDALLARGATVHLPMHEPALPAHAVAWRDNPSVHPAPNISLDHEASVVAFYASLPELWASIHLVGGYAMSKLADTSLADFEKQWRLNTVTCFLACREAVKVMRRSGRGGRIVNVAARPVVQPAGGMVSYVTAKAGVASLTQSLAAELLPENILVNAIVPSIIDTPANRASMPKADHASWPTPAQLAETITFLASEQNALTTGTLVPVFGRA
jgi:NAD(P)-dependent dehydrogenase (short-subunit alcohol dehydrogenase family)